MFRRFRTRRWKQWADGYDAGWEGSRATTIWLLRKKFERLEETSNSLPNLYTLNQILEVLGE
jgi:hypothetical protein